MSQILMILSLWLHALATIVLIGHYLLLALIYLPVLGIEGGAVLSKVSRCSRPWLYISLAVFFASGVYLTFADSNYLGIGNFGNLWGTLMLVKHVLVLAMIAIGFWFNAILHVGPLMAIDSSVAEAMSRFRWHVNAMSVLGVLILLLTAISQAQ
jgi:uncharacterized membrane protein